MSNVRPQRWWHNLAVVPLLMLLALVLPAGPVDAQASQSPPLSGALQERLDRGIAEARARNAEALRSPGMTDLKPGNEHAASVAVINAAGNPSLAAGIVGYMSDRMPEARGPIARAVAGSFPGFAPEIRVAAGAPPPQAQSTFAQGGEQKADRNPGNDQK